MKKQKINANATIVGIPTTERDRPHRQQIISGVFRLPTADQTSYQNSDLVTSQITNSMPTSQNKSSVSLNPQASTSRQNLNIADSLPSLRPRELPKHTDRTEQSPVNRTIQLKVAALGEQVCTSYAMTHILSYLSASDQIKYQGLNRFFYKVQVRTFAQEFPVANYKHRLHLLNQDYVLLFNFEDMSKHKFVINNSPQLWNHQSIEVRGRIYSTGGAIANSKVYLKTCQVLDESTMTFKDLAPMNFERDAHGICSWKDKYIICVGSWHGPGARTCEMYDVETNTWTVLPQLSDGTCAPGLCVLQNKLYKLGGTSDIGKVEMLDLSSPKKWVTINTSNKYGHKHTINRCLLHPIKPQIIQDAREEDEGKFLVLGCHFGRSEKPFIYDLRSNKYTQFQDKEHFIDMYRSNDVVQFSKKSICIRPFVKVGERPENVKVYQYFLEDSTSVEAAFSSERKRSRSFERNRRQNQSLNDLDQLDGPKRSSNILPQRKSLKPSSTNVNEANQPSQGILSRLSSLFTGGKRQSAPVNEIKQGTLQEVTFRSGVWQSSLEGQD